MRSGKRAASFQLNFLSLALTIGGIFVLPPATAVVVFPFPIDIWLQPLDCPSSACAVAVVVHDLLVVLGLLFGSGRSGSAARLQWLSVGTLAAALHWAVGSAAAFRDPSNFGDYDATYGSLGGAIGLMMWMWLSAIIVLLGAD